MSETSAKEIKTLNGYAFADEKARADIAALSDEIESLKSDDEPIGVAGGDRLLISDCAGGAFNGLKIYGATYQAAKPSVASPQALQPIGKGGQIHLNVSNKNLINRPYYLSDASITRGGVTYTVNNDGSITAIGENTSGSSWGADFLLNNFKGHSVLWSDSISNKMNGVLTNNSLGVTVRDCWFTHYIKTEPYAYISADVDGAINTTLYPQIEFGSKATAFESPVAAQCVTVDTPNGLCGVPVTANSTYTDSQGNKWIADEIDFGNGVYIQRIGQIASYSGESIGTAYLSSTGALTTGAAVHYVLPEPIETPLSDDVIGAYRSLTAHSPNTSVYVTYDASVMGGITGGNAPTVRVEYIKLTEEDMAVESFDPTPYNLPILHLTGDTALMTKDNEVTLNYTYGSRGGTCTCKWQGSSSLMWAKKNYTIKFDNAFEAVEGWGAQKKYCFKANFIDHSHARNLISAKLWGQIVKSRTTANETLNALPNAGAVDGFPCVIMLNGEFHGLYTWNIPKDGWMFGMSGITQQQAILCAEGGAGSPQFKADATLNGDFDLEYASDDNATGWVLPSLNRMINACINSDGSDLDTTLAQYIDWDSVIDYNIFTAMLGGNDMVLKNYILATYDGVKWFFSAYDMDTTYGLNWKGDGFNSSGGYPTITDYNHRAMELVRTYKKDALKARYTKLRNTVLSEDNLYLLFSNFAAGIPRTILEEDARKWPTLPSTTISNTAQILNWYRMRCAKMDALVASM